MKCNNSSLLKAILIIVILLKSFVGFLHFDYINGDKLDYSSVSFKKDFSQQCTDEPEFIASAIYYLHYKKIMTDRSVYLTSIAKTPNPHLTALRPKAYIYLHANGLKLYAKFNKVRIDAIDIYNYLHYYHLLMCLLKTLIFPISVFAFFKSLRILGFERDIQYLGAILYSIIPSVFLFIGYLDLWENIALYSLIVVFYTLLKNLAAKKISKLHFAIFLVLMTISVLFRPHLLLIYLLMFTYVAFVIAKRVFKKRVVLHFTPFVGLFILAIIHIPILIQNQQYFGKYFLSTQSNYEFYQGHNQFARGSWNMNLVKQHPAYFDSLIQSNNLINADELTESIVFKKIGMEWMMTHPIEEVELSLRKVAGYFLPYNFMNHRFNVYTAILFVSFCVFLFLLARRIFKKQSIVNLEYLVLTLIPCVGSIGLTLLFFVGERWRFYAEPFFLIMLISIVIKFLSKKKEILQY
jgi:hypothetical protein